MTKINKKVLMCLSGGVDSSVVAALLLKSGYDVTAAFMVNYEDKNAEKSCWHADYQDALRVAAKLGIKLLRLDFTKEYSRDVLTYMYAEYSAGRTPNPDVLCNKFVKFGAWLDRARELGFDFIATGHYASLSVRHCHPHESGDLVSKKDSRLHGNDIVLLMEAKDKNKDQTYFLHQLNQEQLKNILFPLGDYTKDEVRKLAKKFDLATAEKEESMGICFIGEVSMKDFLKGKIKSEPGNIVDSLGNILGKHEGLPYYTIGQRGLGIAETKGKPLFVVDKNLEKNELVVGFEDDPRLYKKEITVSEVNWIDGQMPIFPLKLQVRLRHRQELQDAVLNSERTEAQWRNPLVLKFDKPQRAVTPGQFAVLYKKGICLGGGVIN